MKDSFFKKNNFKIIERKILNEIHVLNPEVYNSEIITVYDMSSWKLTPYSLSNESQKLVLQELQLEILKKNHVNAFGLCVTMASEVEIAANYASFLYIPGEFCRQSDLLEAAKDTKLPLVVEKGVFLCPNDISRLCTKIKGSDYSLVECGTTNGYSDVILDPRSLHLLKKNTDHFGICLSDLFACDSFFYTHRPAWLNDYEFIDAFIKTGKSFNANYFVIKNVGAGKLIANQILKMVK